MDEKTMSFNETQLKRVGFAEAFTPELKKQMEAGLPAIQHQFKKEFEGDKVHATLHLKKSTTSDHYFLNKFDMSLQKDGQTGTLNQTFYVNQKKATGNEDAGHQKIERENRYTLKEAYNLLAGRPVFKHLTSKEGNAYDAWVKLDFKNKLDNGNHEMKQYTQAYGFDLKQALLKYPIKEMTNELYANRLMESLQRGNLQKVTFVDPQGKEDKLYISPNITLGALNVYDENRQRLTTEMLVDKQYLSPKAAGEIKQHYNQEQKNGQKETAKQDMPAEKKTRKQKLH